MITNETITARFAADRHAAIAWKKQLSADLDTIVTAYGAADKPADTIATAAAKIGIDRARAIIATLTVYRVAMCDRRIGDDTAAWAQTIADALDADAAERVGLITDAIHPAHLDQLARAAAEYVAPETTETTEAAETAETPADGEYSVNVTLEGGSGRATVESPAALTVADGRMTATIVWSSPNYDYMLVDGEKYLPTNTEGNSTFEIPVTALDTPLDVVGDTVAMSTPHEIEYTLTFASASLIEAK